MSYQIFKCYKHFRNLLLTINSAKLQKKFSLAKMFGNKFKIQIAPLRTTNEKLFFLKL